MHDPGPKELPDVGPSGAPYEFGSSRADASIEQSGNERGRELRWNKDGGGGRDIEAVWWLMKAVLIEVFIKTP